MDDPAASRAELDASLRFIRSVNRFLGGAGAAIRELRRWSTGWSRDERIRIIDLGTGSADIPLQMVRWASSRGYRLQVVATDLHPTTLELAREHVGDREDIELAAVDATTLMDHYEPGSFDYAHAGMFLHHLPDVTVLTVLRIMDRLVRRGLIWNDPVRSSVGRLGVRLLTIGSPPMVKHDGIVSVDAGFTRREALDLAHRVGLERVRYRTHLLHRFTLVSDKAK
jgi:hypothetical protein